jgi:hypothetical protein
VASPVFCRPLILTLPSLLGEGENGPLLPSMLLKFPKDVLGLGVMQGILTGSVVGGLLGNGVSVRGL